MEEKQWQIKEIHGLAQTTSPRYTTTLIRRHLSKSNPCHLAETAADSALGYRYSCGPKLNVCEGIASGLPAFPDKENRNLRARIDIGTGQNGLME